MRVKLLKDVEQGGTLKVAKIRGRHIPFMAGTEMEMSDTSAKKYIDQGIAEPVQAQEGAPQEVPAEGRERQVVTTQDVGVVELTEQDVVKQEQVSTAAGTGGAIPAEVAQPPAEKRQGRRK